MSFVESVWWMRMYQVPGPTSSQKNSSSYFRLEPEPVDHHWSASNIMLSFPSTTVSRALSVSWLSIRMRISFSLSRKNLF